MSGEQATFMILTTHPRSLSSLTFTFSYGSSTESKKKGEKQIKEQQKKQLRKAKSLFRKLTMAAYQSANPNDVSIGKDAVWDDLEKMNDDVSVNRRRDQKLMSTKEIDMSIAFLLHPRIYFSHVSIAHAKCINQCTD